MLAKLLRKAATKLVSATVQPGLVIEAGNLREYLGRPRLRRKRTSVRRSPGCKACCHRSRRRRAVRGGVGFGGVPRARVRVLTLTGQLGEVMKESAQIALSYVRAHADQLGITDPAILDRHIHIHVRRARSPRTAPRPESPWCCSASMALGRPVRSDVGMTGEVTLNGRVLPIGGVKQKLLAAQRAGLTTVFVPKRNEPDLDDVPADVLETITIVPTTDVAELVALAIEPVSSANNTAVAA